MSHLVRFFDIDGTILKQEYVTTGANATAPATPNYDPKYLIFAEWNQPFTNVQSDLNVGAIYDTVDGKTYIFIRINNITTASPSSGGFRPFVQVSSNSSVTIDWGDGTTTTTSAGNIQKPTAYSAIGDYVISIDCSGIYRNPFQGQLVPSTGVLKIYLGTNFRTSPLAFLNNFALNVISLNKELGDTDRVDFTNCRSLKHVNATSLSSGGTLGDFLNCHSLKYISISAPNVVTTRFQQSYNVKNILNITMNVGGFTLQNCYNLEGNITLGTNTTVIGDAALSLCTSLESVTMLGNITSVENAFGSCTRLTEMEFPASLTSISSNAFDGCVSILEYTFNSTTPPTLGSSGAFNGINAACKIYVPDASVATYKAANNWSNLANYIYPLSTKP